MQSGPSIVGRIEHAVDSIAVQLAGVVILHCLKVQLCLRRHSLVGSAAARTITQYGTGHVSSVSVAEVSGRGVTGRHGRQSSHSTCEVAVVVIEARVSNRNLLAAAIQTGDECRLNRINSHVVPSLVVVQYQDRHGSDVGNRWVSDDVVEVLSLDGAPKPALFGRPRIREPN